MKTKKQFSATIVAAACIMFSNINAQNTFPSTGNAGIGTTSPASSLEIAVTSTLGAKLRNRSTASTADGSILFDMVNSSNNLWRTAVGGKNNGLGINAGQYYIERAGIGSTFLIDQAGNVAIGNSAPTAQLDVASAGYMVGRFRNKNTSASLDGSALIDISNSQNKSWRLTTSGINNGLGIAKDQFYVERTGAGVVMLFTTLGNVLINKATQSNTTYKLDVNGKIRANELVVNTTGADFVFADDYHLRKLTEVEQFIKVNKHLPEIPAAKVMAEEGMEVGELTKTLLQKVEELTLYIIEQQKQIDSLEAKQAE